MQTFEQLEASLQRNKAAWHKYNQDCQDFIARRVNVYGDTRREARRKWIIYVMADPGKYEID